MLRFCALMRPAVAGLIGTAFIPIPASAQSILELQPGGRIRVETPGFPGPLNGTLVRATPDTLWVRWTEGDTAAVLASNLRKLEVSRGQGPRRVGESAGRGFVIGAAIGATFGAVMVLAASPEDTDFFGGTLGTVAAVAAVFAAPGLVVGALAGVRRAELWEQVALR